MTTLIRSALAMLLFAQAAQAGETEWPEFRGPTGMGISAAKGVPIEWSATKNVVWKVEIPGAGWSSPVVSQGRLYLTTALSPEGGATTLRALCLQAADGKVVWDTQVFEPNPGDVAAMHKKNSPASATPIVRDGKVYVHFGHMGTAALDLEGKVLWQQTGLGYAPTHGNGGSPVVAGDLLIFSADGGPAPHPAANDGSAAPSTATNPETTGPFVAALDLKTGAVRWKTPRKTTAAKHFSFCTPLAIQVDGHPQIISPGSGFVGAYEPQNGQEIWKVTYGEGYSVVPRPVFANGLLYVCSGFNKSVLYAIDPKLARGDATSSHVRWTLSKGAPLTPSPLVVGHDLYLMADNGIATCADALTGDVRWTQRLKGDFSSSPILAEGRIYFQNETGTTYVVKPGAAYEQLAQNDLGERTLASCAVADGALYIRSESHLWKIGHTP